MPRTRQAPSAPLAPHPGLSPETAHAYAQVPDAALIAAVPLVWSQATLLAKAGLELFSVDTSATDVTVHLLQIGQGFTGDVPAARRHLMRITGIPVVLHVIPNSALVSTVDKATHDHAAVSSTAKVGATNGSVAAGDGDDLHPDLIHLAESQAHAHAHLDEHPGMPDRAMDDALTVMRCAHGVPYCSCSTGRENPTSSLL